MRAAALAGAVAFLLLGGLGLVPGVTTHYGELRFAGGSHAQLFGVFRVSILLELVHLAIGAAGVALARTTAGARAFLAGGGTASLVLWLLGATALGGWLPVGYADNWLHLALGVALLGLGILATREAAVSPASA
jgi:hypothetical protein